MSALATLQEQYPRSDLKSYAEHVHSMSGADHKHHICPRAEFPELTKVPENIKLCSFQEHFYAHYLLALAVPECSSFQLAFYFMTNNYASKLLVEKLSFYAEVYERGMLAASNHMKKLHTDPVFAAARDVRASAVFKLLHANPILEAKRKAAALLGIRTGDSRAMQSAAELKKLSDPTYYEAHVARARKLLNKLHADPSFKEKLKAGLLAKHADPAYAIIQSERSKKSAHERWHVKRAIASPECSLCSAEIH